MRLMIKRLLLLLAVVGALAAPGAVQAATTTNVTIQSATLLNNFQVQVVGTIQCVSNEQYQVQVSVLQRGPGQVNQQGFGSTSGVCVNNGPQGWVVTAQGGPFSPGKAFIQATGQVCGFTACAQDTDDRTIKLQRA